MKKVCDQDVVIVHVLKLIKCFKAIIITGMVLWKLWQIDVLHLQHSNECIEPMLASCTVSVQCIRSAADRYKRRFKYSEILRFADVDLTFVRHIAMLKHIRAHSTIRRRVENFFNKLILWSLLQNYQKYNVFECIC